MADIIPETLKSSDAEAKFKALRSEQDDIFAQIKSHTESIEGLKRQLTENSTKRTNAEREVVYAKHIEAGLCAYLVPNNDGWRTFRKPCGKRASKQRLCGIHHNLMERRSK